MQGIPVVATAVGGTPSIIENERSGLLYFPGAIHALVAALYLLAHNCEYARHLAEEAQAFAQEHLSAQALIEAHEDLYHSLAGEPAVQERSPPGAPRSRQPLAAGFLPGIPSPDSCITSSPWALLS